MSDKLFNLEITNLKRDPKQPRKVFTPESLRELTTSIKAQGIIQPIIVRKDPKKDGHYLIVAGERRYRAAKRAKLTVVPAILKADTDGQEDAKPDLANVRSIQLTENFHREDLSLIEIFDGINEFIAESKTKVTNKMLADRFGMNTTYWSRVRKLEKAPETLMEFVKEGKITNINVISSFVSLYELDQNSFQDVWGDMVNGNITTNLEKYVAAQHRMAKQIKEHGFIIPEPNEHGVYSETSEGVINTNHQDKHDLVDINVYVLQIAKDTWAMGTSFKVLDSGRSSPITAKRTFESQELATICGLEAAGEHLVETIKQKDTAKAYGGSCKYAVKWVNSEIKIEGGETVFEMPEPPQPSTPQHEEKQTGGAESTTTATHEDSTETSTTTTEMDDSAVLHNDYKSENVVAFQPPKPTMPDTTMLEVPNAIQEQLSRICGYYHAVSGAMSEADALEQIETMVATMTGSSSAQVH